MPRDPASPRLPPDAVPPLGAGAPALETAAVPTEQQAPRWTSQELMGGHREIEIGHAGSVYRLRLTALGRLILTK